MLTCPNHNNPFKSLCQSCGAWFEFRGIIKENCAPCSKKESRRRYEKKKRVVDLNYRLKGNLRSRMNRAVKTNQKAGSATRDLGVSILEFRRHIEVQFAPGMSWENWGDWHLDHVKPLAAFDLTDRKQFLEACHYTNLQPLWARENRAKGVYT